MNAPLLLKTGHPSSATAPQETARTPPPQAGAESRAGTVLILGNYRAALTTARRLSARGCRVVLGSEPHISYCDRSRFVDEVWHCPPFEPHSPAFREALLRKVETLPPPVTVMPVLERPMNAVASIEPDLVPRVRIALPEARILDVLHDKYNSLVCARDAGLDVPPFALCSSADAVCEAVGRIGLPVVIRPTVAGTRLGTQKAVTLYTDADVARFLADPVSDIPGLLVQRRFVGIRTNVYFAAKDGRILSEQHSKSFRTDRADGTGQTVDGTMMAPIPSISKEIHRIVAVLKYTGVGTAQFLYDAATDSPCFLEINARFGGSYAAVERAGMDMTGYALDLAWNDAWPVEDRTGRFDTETRFAWTLGDISGLLYAIRRREVGAGGALLWLWHIVVAAIRSDAHVTWSWRDPVPTLILYARAVANTLGLRKTGLHKPQ
jgi:carbamoylphosphate synthase large subunit